MEKTHKISLYQKWGIWFPSKSDRNNRTPQQKEKTEEQKNKNLNMRG